MLTLLVLWHVGSCALRVVNLLASKAVCKYQSESIDANLYRSGFVEGSATVS